MPCNNLRQSSAENCRFLRIVHFGGLYMQRGHARIPQIKALRNRKFFITNIKIFHLTNSIYLGLTLNANDTHHHLAIVKSNRLLVHDKVSLI